MVREHSNAVEGSCQRLRIIHIGSYWMKSNDVVFLMARDLAEICDLRTIDPGVYDGNQHGWYVEDRRENVENPVRWLSHGKIMQAVEAHRADAVVVNSGGLSLLPNTIGELRRRGIATVVISLSDPDVFPYHGRMYAHLYDIVYTNSLYASERLYKPVVQVLAFAASSNLHRPLVGVSKIYDVVIVGHARQDRWPTVERLRNECSVGLFGSRWGGGTMSVNGLDHVRALNSGRMYLSFSATVAGYTNVKVGLFEAAACRVLLITQQCEELERYFRRGEEVVTYRDLDELVELVRFYREHETERERIAHAAYSRVLREHTWTHRWRAVLREVGFRIANSTSV